MTLLSNFTLHLFLQLLVLFEGRTGGEEVVPQSHSLLLGKQRLTDESVITPDARHLNIDIQLGRRGSVIAPSRLRWCFTAVLW